MTFFENRRCTVNRAVPEIGDDGLQIGVVLPVIGTKVVVRCCVATDRVMVRFLRGGRVAKAAVSLGEIDLVPVRRKRKSDVHLHAAVGTFLGGNLHAEYQVGRLSVACILQSEVRGSFHLVDSRDFKISQVQGLEGMSPAASKGAASTVATLIKTFLMFNLPAIAACWEFIGIIHTMHAVGQPATRGQF